ncbi:hypothetical protein [Methanolobus chelungpuianus]|uniref:hypothetical protein n=1 Tax=Methanolobus chelungpuianus TaxID=502115 RepID=UPI0021145281|nr:hypothetical protein [Methanolobus chelungpuianus]
MNCSTCDYRRSIPLYTKCAGIAGRCRAGTSYYCSHPEIGNPVPLIPADRCVLDDCPVIKNLNDASAHPGTAG